MRSYLDIVIDLKEGKEVSKQELGLALLFAANQLTFASQDINKLMDDKYNKPLIRKMMKENIEIRFKARKSPIEQWFGNDIPVIH